jgi:hypothetical protein
MSSSIVSNSAPAAQSSLIVCRAGLRPIPNSPQNEMYIVSPRTKREISFSDGFFDRLPAGMVAKVAKACATGNHAIAFTRDELAAAGKIWEFLTAPIKAILRPPLQGTPATRWGHKKAFSRSWGRGR